MLRESFDTPNDVERYKTSCRVFNTQMRKRASVTNHILYMIEQIKRLSKLDFFLYEQLEKDAILNSLSKSYLSFLSHFRITKPIVNYYGLLGLLQTFKKDHQPHKETVNIVGGSSSDGRRPFKKEKKKKRRCKVLGVRPKSPNSRPTKVKQSTSIARSRITKRGTALNTQLS